MKTGLIEVAVMTIGMAASIAHVALSAPVDVPASATTSAVIAPNDGIAVGDRYLVPQLPEDILDELPAAEQAGDQYLAERVAVADLVTGERILAAEDLVNQYARDLPGFTEVLEADGFHQDTDGSWFYDPFSSWMRFALNR